MSPAQFLGILGFSPADQPTLSQLKQRWKDLCRKHHPDTGGDVEIFRKVTHAYRYLTDAEYRQRALEDELRRGNRNIRGDLNLRIVCPVSFEDAFFGRMVHVSFNRQHLDQELKPIKLEMLDVHSTLLQLPPGSTSGYECLIQGGGHMSGQVFGDAIVSIVAQPHPRFHVQGMDVTTTEQIPLDIMVKGGKLEVLTMYGLKTVKVPAGSKNGDTVKVKRCGVAQQGSHVVALEAIFPTKDDLKGEAWAGLKIDFAEEAEPDEEERQYLITFGQMSSIFSTR